MPRTPTHLVVAILLVMTCKPAWVCKAQIGRFLPVEDLGEPQVTTAAHYAIYWHDADTGSHLKLVNIVSGEVQYAVGGANYRLIIFAQDGVQINSSEANVYVPNPRVSAPLRLVGFLQIS